MMGPRHTIINTTATRPAPCGRRCPPATSCLPQYRSNTASVAP